MKLALLLAASFLMGSVPFGIVASRLRGVDPRNTGSGNIGATNVLRSAGKGAALFTLLGDMLKGTAAVALGMVLDMGHLEQGLMGLASVVGHDFSVFLKFKGGKGVATSMGVMLIYVPMAGILAIVLWLATVFALRYSSLGAIVAFVLLPFAVKSIGYPGEKVIVSVIISALLMARHAGNIKRLMSGTERRIGEKA